MMLSDLFSVRPLKKEDLKMVLTWRNSEKIHSVMLTDHKITWEEHCNWFEKVSRNVPCRNLIFEYRNNPIGYIGYTNYDDEGKKCSPGAYIGVDYNVPIDAGINLFYAAIDYAFTTLGMELLETEVIKTNKRALKIDLFLGYKIVGENMILRNNEMVDSYVLELEKKVWNDFKLNNI